MDSDRRSQIRSRHRTIKRCSLLIGVLLFIVIVVSFVKHLKKPIKKATDSCFPKAAVAADAGSCSEIGRDILKKNGSVVDAAIATLLCVGLYNPHSMGIGGGVVFTIYNASTGNVETIDARETAPMSATADMFDKDPEKAKSGPLAIGVPGLIRGFMMAHKRHRRLEWKDLFEPSIKLAREGIKISQALAEAINEKNDKILSNTAWCEVFCDSNNITFKENETIKFIKLADTYEQIANEGDSFYTGSLRDKIVNDIQAAGGIITSEDLQGFEPHLNEYALNFTVRNYTFHVPDAPFAGPVLAMILKILNAYNITSSSMWTPESKILTYHRIIEAFRFAYAKRSELGDPRFVKINDLIQEMTSNENAKNILSKIDDATTKPDSYYGNSSTFVDYGTSHLSIIAEDGSAVAVTSTINAFFGSMVMSPSTGIIFNNQMRDFSFPEEGRKMNKHNLIVPGKRPLDVSHNNNGQLSAKTQTGQNGGWSFRRNKNPHSNCTGDPKLSVL